MSKNSNQFCNNCGKQGHLYAQCKKPITSSGVIAFRKSKKIDGKYQYLIICRKDSLGFIDFLRGKYPLYDKDYILNLINEMTITEKQQLLTLEFKILWKHLWGDMVGLQYRGEEKGAYEKFTQIKRGIQITGDSSYHLESLINESTTKWETPEWGFPKGRRNYQENDITCGLREFEEETGYSKKSIQVIKNIEPYEEIFVGSNLKSYKHIYFVGYMKNQSQPKINFQTSEVSQLKWLHIDECLEKIRDYNLEKKDIIKNVNKILETYRLISS